MLAMIAHQQSRGWHLEAVCLCVCVCVCVSRVGDFGRTSMPMPCFADTRRIFEQSRPITSSISLITRSGSAPGYDRKLQQTTQGSACKVPVGITRRTPPPNRRRPTTNSCEYRARVLMCSCLWCVTPTHTSTPTQTQTYAGPQPTWQVNLVQYRDDLQIILQC